METDVIKWTTTARIPNGSLFSRRIVFSALFDTQLSRDLQSQRALKCQAPRASFSLDAMMASKYTALPFALNVTVNVTAFVAQRTAKAQLKQLFLVPLM